MARRGENIYKRKDGRYEGRYIKYYDISGKAVYGYVYAKSYSEIKEKLIEYKKEKKNNTSKSSLKLSEWMDFWFKSQYGIKPTTRRIYQGHIQNHINPILGEIMLKKLNSQHLQGFINNFCCSASTVRTVFGTLKAALIAAEENGLVQNVWSKVKLPQKEKTFIQILTKTEQRQLERSLIEKESIGILICLYTGLRIGELCALKWKDIDFEKSVLRVNGTQARTEKGIEIISPKSKSSKREIPIPDFLLKKMLVNVNNSDFVISKSGKAYDVRSYSRYFKTILKRAKLPDIKFHALRHTFSTRALEVGMDYRTLSEILGHSSVAITLDLYAHSLDEHKKNQMNKLEEVFVK